MSFNKLTWGVKASFSGYVEASEGSITLSDGATRTEEGTFVFMAQPGGDLSIAADGSATGAMRFQGTVVFEAHGGMLKSTLAELGLEAGEKTFVEHSRKCCRQPSASSGVGLGCFRSSSGNSICP